MEDQSFGLPKVWQIPRLNELNCCESVCAHGFADRSPLGISELCWPHDRRAALRAFHTRHSSDGVGHDN
jgi:hypothetical protein